MKTNTSGTVLSVGNLNFSINGIEILKNVSFRISKGEFTGLIGPNGAGKTTLLKCLNGLNKPEGRVDIMGKSLNSIGDRKIAREIALMHQNTTIGFAFPALEVVLMGRYPYLRRMQWESGEDYKIARKNMEFTNTLEFENQVIDHVSGGERQRVLFAKTLTQTTDIILLDEPTANLDITHQEQIFRYSKELCSEGKTVIAAVHDLKIASRYCTRLILMSKGEIVADGIPEEVLTTDNLSKVYGVNALVYRNRLTGLLDIYISGEDAQTKRDVKIHVIGGGGSASGVIRQLFDNGYTVTAGVFSPADSDLHCAEVFGLERVVCQPFSDIGEDAGVRNDEFVRKADITILCDMPFGRQNIRNLISAAHSQKLVIIEDDIPEGRDFTGGDALKLYSELRKSATVTTTARLHEVISD